MSEKRYTGAVHDLTLIAAMTAVLEVSKHALDALPNIELVTLLVILYTLYLGMKRTMTSVLIFAAIEALIYGISTWTVTYFYVWPVLVIVTRMIPEGSSKWVYVLEAGIFGLMFGMLCALVTLVIGGPSAAFAWWIAGIPYDLLHCGGNLVITALLFSPLAKTLQTIIRQMKPEG